MFCDSHMAASDVELLVIFSECPIDLDWSVAQVSVAPVGSAPFVQYDGRSDSKLPIADICATETSASITRKGIISHKKWLCFLTILPPKYMLIEISLA
jgi:hypothetical protein